MKIAQEIYKKSYDKKAGTPDFMVRDSVWLYNPKIQPGLAPKLTAKWYGPYYITEKTGPTNYRLRDQKTHKVLKSVVHSDRLKPYLNPALRPTNIPEAYRRQQPEPTELEEDEQICQETHKNGSRRELNKKKERKDESKNRQSQSTVTPDNDPKEWDIEKILKASHYKGCMVYRVRYREKNREDCKTEWVYAENLLLSLRKNFHIKYTFSGKRSKKVTPKPSA